jgi:PAS domain S-box-containing protein
MKGHSPIDEVREQAVNNSLIIGSVLGSLSYVISLMRFFQTGFHFSFVVEFIILAAVIVITLYRKRLSCILKTYVFISLIGLLALSDAITYGLFSAVRVYLILMPFYSIFYLSLRRTLVVFVFVILCLLTVGYLHHIRLFSLPAVIDPANHILKISAWVNHTLSIAVVAIMILFVTFRFLNTFSGLVADLEISYRIISESERNYREVFDSSTDAIFIHDLEGNIVDVNNSMLQIYGYQKEDINRLTIEDVSSNVPPYSSAEIKKLFRDVLKGHKRVFDWHARRKGGELFYVEVALKKTSIGGEERVLAFVRDIDEKKQTALQLENYKNRLETLVKERTAELETTNKELTAANQELFGQRAELESTLSNLQEVQNQLVQSEKMASLGILVSGIAHEINNPLNFIYGGILGIENYIDEHLKNHAKELKPLLEGIQVGARRAADIVASLDHYTRLDNLPRIKCDIHTVIENCLVILKNQMKNRIEIRKDYTREPCVITCNEGKIHQALLNILLNASQAIEDQGSVSITTSMDSQQVVITIADTGCGISKKNLSRITDPFFTTRDPGKGIGLGLSIAYNVFQEQGGTLDFESEVGKGTKVIITLPV